MSCVYLILKSYTSVRHLETRTNIEIDDSLLAQAMAATGQTTKRATVEEALRTVVRIRAQLEALKDLKGSGWERRFGRHAPGRSA